MADGERSTTFTREGVQCAVEGREAPETCRTLVTISILFVSPFSPSSRGTPMTRESYPPTMELAWPPRLTHVSTSSPDAAYSPWLFLLASPSTSLATSTHCQCNATALRCESSLKGNTKPWSDRTPSITITMPNRLTNLYQNGVSLSLFLIRQFICSTLSRYPNIRF